MSWATGVRVQGRLEDQSGFCSNGVQSEDTPAGNFSGFKGSFQEFPSGHAPAVGGLIARMVKMLPSALCNDGGVALNADRLGGFGRHRDAAVVTLPGTWKRPSVSSSW